MWHITVRTDSLKVALMSLTKPPRAILLCDLFDYLRQPMLKFLPLISVHVIAFGENGIGECLRLQAK